VVAIDQRGYGDSDKPESVSAYSIDALRDDVRDVVKALGKERCILVGHDWGGIVAWQVAMFYPTVVEKLIILNCPHPTPFANMIKGSLRQFLKSW
jgi:pimeloyl-ACP methyl ester carboxylesterase